MSHLENERQLTNCGRVEQDLNSFLWRRGTIANKKLLKGSEKVWEDSIQWLRT